MLKKTYHFVLIVLVSAGLTACGGGNTTTETSSEPASTPEPATEEPAAEEPAEEEPAAELVADVEVELSAIGEDMSAISYKPSELTVEAYTVVKINFTNTATMEGMNHNAVVIPFDEKVADEIRTAGMKAGGPSFRPEDDRIIAQSKMLNPGETDGFTFETPGPGKYYIICTFPGHKAMVATMNVE